MVIIKLSRISSVAPSTLRAHAFAIVVNPDREWNANDNGESCEQRVPAAITQLG